MQMISYIALKIEDARRIGLEEGQAKYAAFFVKTKIYAKYKADVDAILTIDGYDDVIPVE